jgi:hypothetical protein
MAHDPMFIATLLEVALQQVHGHGIKPAVMIEDDFIDIGGGGFENVGFCIEEEVVSGPRGNASIECYRVFEWIKHPDSRWVQGDTEDVTILKTRDLTLAIQTAVLQPVKRRIEGVVEAAVYQHDITGMQRDDRARRQQQRLFDAETGDRAIRAAEGAIRDHRGEGFNDKENE